MISTRRIQEEIKALNKNDDKDLLYNIKINENNIFKWTAKIKGPTDSPYEGGIFKIDINFPDNYPFKAPKMVFTSPIIHVNVSSEGSICLDILSGRWSAALKTRDVLISIISLLTDPNPNDPYNSDLAQYYMDDRVLYEKKVREYIKEKALTSFDL